MRVEWTVLDGAMTEAILATCIYIERPRSNRIRPSQGDYGIDVLEPVGAGDAKFDVWQIKRFASKLGASEKRQIEKSFQRAMLALVRRRVRLRHWHLVLPLDPTIENRLDWFAEMPARAFGAMRADSKLALTPDETETIRRWLDDQTTETRWEGLDFCEAAIADHPEVPDYFIHGGAERLRDAVATLSSLLATDRRLRVDDRSPAILQPSEISEHLHSVQSALDGDPHFRYGFQVEPHQNQVHPEPDLVAATQFTWPSGETLTYRIYTRFDEALNERPIPVKMQFLFDDPEFDNRAFQDWQMFGTEFDAPAIVEVGLPGGLDTAKEGRVRFPAHPSAPFQRRFRLATPNGEKMADLMFNCTSTVGLTRRGARMTGVDVTGVVSVDFRGTLGDGETNVSFTTESLDGLEAQRAAPAVKFMSSWTAGNRLQVAEAFGGRFVDVHPVPRTKELIHPLIAVWIEALSQIQEHTNQTIVLPDLASVTHNDVRRVLDAAAMLRGQTVVARWSELELSGITEGGLGGHVQLETYEPFEVAVGTERISLGTQLLTFLSADLTVLGQTARARPKLNDTVHRKFLNSEPPSGPSVVRGRAAPDDHRQHTEAGACGRGIRGHNVSR
ncbi:hypothetical protein Q9S36_10695 [Microbacterium sp. ARD31]|uniref:hypothetical protein n=1 Tax=Microbacterium sp. ARD31 TaxID=2962576 RepID=UPI002881CE73|nr:hypothetical protein [Microbacterium sp. ARD31]MDT0180664.1 hypothetical protein [Microbacterium sp. ARD31]